MKKLIVVLLAICMSASVYAKKEKKPKTEDLLLMIETLQTQVVELQAQVAALQTGVGDNKADITALQSRFSGVSRGKNESNYDTLFFEGMNLQIINGTGETGLTNGTGNLTIGYNELRTEWNPRDGSHMLVMGGRNNYTENAYAGMLVGDTNEVDAPYATIISSGSWIDHYGALILGGGNQRVHGDFATISGGSGNLVLGTGATVSGGHLNVASGDYASVSGGYENEASGFYSSISGGWQNQASGDYASVSGGSNRAATTNSCTVADNYTNC